MSRIATECPRMPLLYYMLNIPGGIVTAICAHVPTIEKAVIAMVFSQIQLLIILKKPVCHQKTACMHMK